MKNEASTYFFIGRISDFSAEYQVQNKFIDGNYVFELFMSGISIWGKSDKPFEEVRSEIIQMLDTIFGLFTLSTNKPLIYTLEHWVETKENVATKNIIGWFKPTNNPVRVRSMRSPINTAWKNSVKYCRKVLSSNPNYSLALQDYHKSIIDTGDEAFFYAYRAVEDICRAVSGMDDTKESAWDKMHKDLGTTKEQLDSLLKVAEEIRHGKKNTQKIKDARTKRAELLGASKQIVEIAFNKHIFM
ncbi:MAG TPA: hypothetical protein PKA38_02885 [Candidatus Levybacteria bacterium]|nr:hypothetical protein [Candidatus Levybacteria bacterium]